MNFSVNRTLYKRLLENGTREGLLAVGEQALADSNEFVRIDQGQLKESGRFDLVGGDVELSYNTPYAKRVYYTGNPSRAVNANATLQWMHKAKKTYGADWLKIMNKSFAGGMK